MATINSCNTQLIVQAASGSVTYPLQPAFLATGGAQANVTGDGTVYTVLFATEVVDRQGVYSSPTFTAPVTGKWMISATIYLQQLAAAHTGCSANITTTSSTYAPIAVSAAIRDANNNWQSCVVSALANMTASDTATVTVTVSGSTKVIDTGTTNLLTNFSARLVG